MWVLVSGRRIGDSGARLNVRLYAFDGSKVKSLWSRGALVAGSVRVEGDAITLEYEEEYHSTAPRVVERHFLARRGSCSQSKKAIVRSFLVAAGAVLFALQPLSASDAEAYQKITDRIYFHDAPGQTLESMLWSSPAKYDAATEELRRMITDTALAAVAADRASSKSVAKAIRDLQGKFTLNACDDGSNIPLADLREGRRLQDPVPRRIHHARRYGHSQQSFSAAVLLGQGRVMETGF